MIEVVIFKWEVLAQDSRPGRAAQEPTPASSEHHKIAVAPASIMIQRQGQEALENKED
uniref:Uncharacterized protein n=1 Tax=Oryza sativa subsp. japonica TaxID=39947 RepID=Q84T95_ORYSJ|nr:hypothetical protein [Oryza sativa Japonica Group]